ncbi:MAG: ferrochelatase [Pirellulaceae bacterium]|nr:ferrochelatase [Pirellulaceae bacterium]
MNSQQSTIDCILWVSFGGPEGPDDVIPFLENVLRGKPVPRERLLEVAEHYLHFGGVSPINAQNRDLIARLQQELQAAGIDLPIYWGNRNWSPYLVDALREIQHAGHRLPLPIFTNMFSSYSGCRQYRENIAAAQSQLGPDAPRTAPRLRFGFNHPRFIAAQAQLVQSAIEKLPQHLRADAKLLYTAHSIPISMSDHCQYVRQLSESAELIARQVVHPDRQGAQWELVYQSRSGPPQQPWLEPDIGDRLGDLAQQGVKAVIVVPLGFVTDHLEVLYDLDLEAQQACQKLGVAYSRAPAVGTHPEFVRMIVDLIIERLQPSTPRACVGNLSPVTDECAANCCLYPRGGPIESLSRPSGGTS